MIQPFDEFLVFETFSRAELLRIVGALELRQVEIEDFNERPADPRDAGEVERLLGKIAKRLDAARTLPGYEGLEKQACEIRGWIREHGVAPPTRFVMTGRKRRGVDRDGLPGD